MTTPNAMANSKRMPEPENNRPHLCGATLPHANGVNWWTCMRRKDHLLKAGKYARQHMDPKHSPPKYWDPTNEEIVRARESAA